MKTNADLRKFGFTVGIALAVIGGIAWWRDAPAAPYLGAAGVILVVLGLLFPRTLRPIEFVWMKIALVLSYVMTRVILTLAFYLAITPTALLLRLLRKDLLSLRLDRRQKSYWMPVEEDGGNTRPEKPY